jgi:primase-polymerase (primpol)-like protein
MAMSQGFRQEVVPACLRQRRQWVCWRYIERDGKRTKCPFNARTGGMADSTDVTTWSSFEEAVQACQTDKRYEGVGFVFAADDPYCGIDLDNCIDPATGELKAWGQQFIDQLDS